MMRGGPPSQLPGSPGRCPRFTSIIAIGILALVSGFPFAVRADETPNAIQYRRIFVPADKMEAWPRDGEKLIPIESRDFDESIRSANNVEAQINQAAINTAEYSARLEKDGQLHGDGRWTIVAHGEKPTILPLGDLSLVLRNANWQDAVQKPARIGVWGHNNRAPSRFGLEVVRSGTLKFDWTPRHIRPTTRSKYLGSFPAANSTRLTLDLPEGKQPRIEGGVVLESSLLPSDDKTPGKPLRRWVIGLSPVSMQQPCELLAPTASLPRRIPTQPFTKKSITASGRAVLS